MPDTVLGTRDSADRNLCCRGVDVQINKSAGKRVGWGSSNASVLPPSGSPPALLLKPAGCSIAPLMSVRDTPVSAYRKP